MNNFTCIGCEKHFSRNDNLKRHQNTCKLFIKKNEMILCEGCEKYFSRRDVLIRHQKTCKMLIVKELQEENRKLMLELQQKEAELNDKKLELNNKEVELNNKEAENNKLQDLVNKGYEKQLETPKSIQQIIINNYPNNPNYNQLRLPLTSENLLTMIETYEQPIDVINKLMQNTYCRGALEDRCAFTTDASRNNIMVRDNNNWVMDKGFLKYLKKLLGHTFNEIQPLIENIHNNNMLSELNEADRMSLELKLQTITYEMKFPSEKCMNLIKKELSSYFAEK